VRVHPASRVLAVARECIRRIPKSYRRHPWHS
jgi:hypothetical protein